MSVNDTYKVSNPHWKCEDTIIYKDGRVEKRESHNTIVRGVSNLIAALMGLKLTKGIQYWAMGTGEATWDSQWNSNPPSPSYDDTQLINETYRHPIKPEDVKFVDSEGNELSDNTLSNRIMITITVAENQGNGAWREFGIVGGNATPNKNTGILIDHKYHKVIEKTEEMSIIRKLTLEF